MSAASVRWVGRRNWLAHTVDSQCCTGGHTLTLLHRGLVLQWYTCSPKLAWDRQWASVRTTHWLHEQTSDYISRASGGPMCGRSLWSSSACCWQPFQNITFHNGKRHTSHISANQYKLPQSIVYTTSQWIILHNTFCMIISGQYKSYLPCVGKVKTHSNRMIDHIHIELILHQVAGKISVPPEFFNQLLQK